MHFKFANVKIDTSVISETKEFPHSCLIILKDSTQCVSPKTTAEQADKVQLN